MLYHYLPEKVPMNQPKKKEILSLPVTEHNSCGLTISVIV